MAKKYIGENAIAFLVSLLKGELTKKVDNTDPRLIDSRNPVPHASTHRTGGVDQIVPTDIGAVASSDIVDNLVTPDATKVLSANMGKELNDRINNLDINADLSSLLNGIKGEVNGLCPLGADRVVPSQYLPSFVDDVVEGYYVESITEENYEQFFFKDAEHGELIEPESGKIYVDLDTNNSYRWGGSVYILITSSDMVEISNDDIESIWTVIMNGITG